MNIIKLIFSIILEMSIISTIIGIITLILKNIFKTKISPRWLNIIWLVFLITLINPIRLSSNFSIYNFVNYESVAENQDINKLMTTKALDEYTKNESEWKINLNKDDIASGTLKNKEKQETQKTNINSIILKVYKKYFKFIIALYLFVILTKAITNILANIKLNKNQKALNQARLNKMINEIKNQAKITKDIKLIDQDIITTPCIYGTQNIKLLLTKNILKMTDEELKVILMHELNHLKRGDILLNKVIQILKIVYWFNPIILYLLNQVKKDMELANDEEILETIGVEQANFYCKTLLKVAVISNNQNNLALGMVNNVRDLEERIKMIKSINQFSKNKVLIIATIAILVLGITVVFATNKLPENMKDYINEEQNNSGENILNDNSEIETLVFIKPLEGKLKISSKYGTRVHPVTGEKITHTGIDMVAKNGETVMSAEDGIVTFADYNAQDGNAIEIMHENKATNEIIYTYYAHLSKIEVKEGDVVEQGDKIGEVGSTGYSTGSHLHFEIRDSKRNAINPEEYIEM